MVLVATAVAQAPAPDVSREPAVELPTYTVTDTRELPPPEKWSYGRIAGFEVLSNASVGATKKLVVDFQKYSQALGFMWPAIQRRSAVKVAPASA